MATASPATAVAPVDRLEFVSRAFTLLAFALATAALLLAPLMAARWVQLPFPGFYVASTLVVNGSGPAHPPRGVEGLTWPQRVERISGRAVETGAAFRAVLAEQRFGDVVTVFTVEPDGAERLYQSVVLYPYPRGELVRRFWLPYLMGAAYLAIGVWVYGLQGRTRPGRALAFFCACAAAAMLLLFEATTSHAAVVVWTLAMSALGGTLISLAMRFPEEWHHVVRWPWVLAVPYLVSIVIGIAGALSLTMGGPWAHDRAWSAAYIFAGVGIITFLASTLFRARRGRTHLARQQARIVLVGSVVAFTPVTLWFLGPVFGRFMPFNTILFLPPLLLFPFSVMVAIVRYRLWEVDSLVNRTLVYGTLTALLAGLYTASIGLSQRLFVALTGERSDAAIVITTLVVASAFTPLRARLQAAVDQRLGDPLLTLRPLRDYSAGLQTYMAMSHAAGIGAGLLDHVARSLDAESGILRVWRDGALVTAHALPGWREEIVVSIPVEHDGRSCGLLQLGPRRGERGYTGQEIDAVSTIVAEVAPYIGPEAAAGRTAPLGARP